MLKLQGLNAEADIALKRLETRMRQAGTSFSDGVLQRGLMQLIDGLGIVDDMKGVKNFFKGKTIGGRNLWDFKKTDQ